MKKVVDINLGGQKFTIDEDAYQDLENYLNSINKHFATSSGFEDIIYDIENRIAELLVEDSKGSNNIITLSKVHEIKKTMGTPNDFGAEESASQSDSHSLNKRLFRDKEDSYIAGVASGLSAYYGFNSPTLFRALFAVMAFTGIGVLPYIILWIVIPEAKTASDRLSMYGEDINIDSIANAVEESLLDIKDTLGDIHKNFKKKMM